MRVVSMSTVVVLSAVLSAVAVPAEAATASSAIVVAVDGDDSAAGTLDHPLRTIQKAVDKARPGDTIAIRGGTYALVDNITITTSGEASLPISLGAYQGERVVIDGEQLPASHTPVGGSIPRAERGAIHQEASHWRVSGLEIVNGPYGYYCDGCDNNVFSRLTTRDNYETGFQLQGTPATTRSSTSTATATATRGRTARARTAWASRRAAERATSCAARDCGTTSTTASTPGSSRPRS